MAEHPHVKAAAKAVGWWLVIYVLLLHGVVLLKWPPSGGGADSLAAQYLPAADLPTQEDIDQLLKEISEAKEQDSNQQRANEMVNKYQSTLILLDKKAPSSSSLLSLGTSSADIQKLRLAVLLQRESLSNVTDTTFASISAVTVKELEELITKQYQVDWTVVHDLILPEKGYPAKKHLTEEEMHNMICAVLQVDQEDSSDDDDVENDNDDDFDVDLSSYAMEEDLKTALDVVEVALKARTTDQLDQFTSQSEKMKKKLKHAVQSLVNALEDASSFVVTTAKENQKSQTLAKSKPSARSHHAVDISHCLDEEDLLDLVEVGLDALHRKKDLRSALLDAFEEMDAEAAKNLILDADLDSEPVFPDMGSNTAMNLRQVIDKPALKQLAYLIDRVFELISGHNDWLDQQLDKLAGGQRSSLGKVVIATILKHSGQVDVPLPPQLQNVFPQR